MKPLARTDRMIKQVVGQETLVYDPRAESACCLNPLAAAVWHLCDGEHTVPEIAALVAAQVDLPEGLDAETAVWRALEELEENNLIDGPLEVAGAGMGRRDVLKAFAFAPLFPAIQRIMAPSISSAASGPPPASPTPLPSFTPSVSQSMTPTVTLP